jgi:type VI secretion system secreted protein Hcp
MADFTKSLKAVNVITRPLLAGAVAVAALSAVDAQAAMFLKLDGIKGESTDSKHKDEIDVISFQFGLTADHSLSSGGAIRVTSPTCEGFSITKTLDKSSPLLASAAMTGKVIKTGTVALSQEGKSDTVYYTMILTDVVVASFAQSGRESAVPVEEVSFLARQLELRYRPPSEKGAPGAEVRATLDCTSSGKF